MINHFLLLLHLFLYFFCRSKSLEMLGNIFNLLVDIDIGYVLSANLNIIRDRKRKKLIQKGPSYRERSSINWDS